MSLLHIEVSKLSNSNAMQIILKRRYLMKMQYVKREIWHFKQELLFLLIECELESCVSVHMQENDTYRLLPKAL